MLATDNWCINISDRIYGPYTQDQMAGFVTEGRLACQSLVSPAGGNIWREARKYPALSNLLNHADDKTPQFGKSGADEAEASKFPEGAEANLMLVFDVTMGTAGKVSEMVKELGSAFRMTDNVWMLRTTKSAMGVRNAIGPHLDVREPFLIVDCSRGRTTWQNFLPEIQSKLNAAWIKT